MSFRRSPGAAFDGGKHDEPRANPPATPPGASRSLGGGRRTGRQSRFSCPQRAARGLHRSPSTRAPPSWPGHALGEGLGAGAVDRLRGASGGASRPRCLPGGTGGEDPRPRADPPGRRAGRQRAAARGAGHQGGHRRGRGGLRKAKGLEVGAKMLASAASLKLKTAAELRQLRGLKPPEGALPAPAHPILTLEALRGTR
jgi:hypothetical protein